MRYQKNRAFPPICGNALGHELSWGGKPGSVARFKRTRGGPFLLAVESVFGLRRIRADPGERHRRPAKERGAPASGRSAGDSCRLGSIGLRGIVARDHRAGDQLQLVEHHQGQHHQPDLGRRKQHAGQRHSGDQAFLGAAELDDDAVLAREPADPACQPGLAAAPARGWPCTGSGAGCAPEFRPVPPQSARRCGRRWARSKWRAAAARSAPPAPTLRGRNPPKEQLELFFGLGQLRR